MKLRKINRYPILQRLIEIYPNLTIKAAVMVVKIDKSITELVINNDALTEEYSPWFIGGNSLMKYDTGTNYYDNLKKIDTLENERDNLLKSAGYEN